MNILRYNYIYLYQILIIYYFSEKIYKSNKKLNSSNNVSYLENIL